MAQNGDVALPTCTLSERVGLRKNFMLIVGCLNDQVMSPHVA